MPPINLRVAIAISVFLHTVVIANVLNQRSLLIDHSKKPLTLKVQLLQTSAPSVALIEPKIKNERNTTHEIVAKKNQLQPSAKSHSIIQHEKVSLDPLTQKTYKSDTAKVPQLTTRTLKENEPLNEKPAEVLPSPSSTSSQVKMHTLLETETTHTEKIIEIANAVHEKTGVAISASYAKNNQKPEYPAMSRKLNEQGTVVLMVLVLEDGTAGKVDIKNSSGFPLLDESAKNALMKWHFIPAKIDGQPINESYTLSIPFVLN